MSVYPSVRLSVPYAFLNGWTDFDDNFRTCLNVSRDDLDSELDPVYATRGGAQTGILFRFKMEIFVYKWLLLVI